MVLTARRALAAPRAAIAARRPAAAAPRTARGDRRLVEDAVAVWKASRYAGGEYLADLTGRGHDARLGSAGSARIINRDGAKYLRLSGVAGNYAGVPHAANLESFTDFEIEAKLTPDSWVSSGDQTVVSKWASSVGYLLRIGASGVLRLGIDASTVLSSTAVVPFIAGQVGYVKASWRASDGRVQFFTSLDGVTWTQLGADVVGPLALTNNGILLRIGERGGSDRFTGRFYYVKLRNNSAGTTVLDVDFTIQAGGATSFVATTGQTVTINSTSGADSNDPLFLPFSGEKYVYFPGSASNNLSLANPVASADYTITYSDGTTQVRTAATANPLVFGNVDVDFAAKKVTGIEVRNNAGGAVVATFAAGAAVEPYATVGAWTLNRSASGRKLAVVDRPLFLFGTDDYLEVADQDDLDFGAADSFTVVVAMRLYNVSTTSVVIAKRTSISGVAGSIGWILTCSTGQVPTFRIDDGTAIELTSGPGIVAGTQTSLAYVRSVSLDTIVAYTQAVAGASNPDATAGSFTNTDPLRIGRLSGAGTSYADMEFIAAAIVRRALSDSEVVRLGEELLAA